MQNLKNNQYRKIHSGYYSDLYLSYDKNIARKIYFHKHKTNVAKDIDITQVFLGELDGTKWLSIIKNPHISTPKILNENQNSLSYEFVWHPKLISFYNYLCSKRHPNQETSLSTIFNNFGWYLARLHNTKTPNGKTRIHGDLKHKNMGFIGEKLFVYDPTFIPELIFSNYKKEIAQMILNFYPFNPVVSRIIKRQRCTWVKNFLQGYFKSNKKSINKTFIYRLTCEIIKKSCNKIMSKDLTSIIKCFLMKLRIKGILKELKQDYNKW